MRNPLSIMKEIFRADKFDGDFYGRVENDTDPEGLHRVRIWVPGVYDNVPERHLPWAYPEQPTAGYAESGFYSIPPKKAWVRVRFRDGHPWYPIYSGAGWSLRYQPPTEAVNKVPYNHVMKTPGRPLTEKPIQESPITLSSRENGVPVEYGRVRGVSAPLPYVNEGQVVEEPDITTEESFKTLIIDPGSVRLYVDDAEITDDGLGVLMLDGNPVGIIRYDWEGSGTSFTARITFTAPKQGNVSLQAFALENTYNFALPQLEDEEGPVIDYVNVIFKDVIGTEHVDYFPANQETLSVTADLSQFPPGKGTEIHAEWKRVVREPVGPPEPSPYFEMIEMDDTPGDRRIKLSDWMGNHFLIHADKQYAEYRDYQGNVTQLHTAFMRAFFKNVIGDRVECDWSLGTMELFHHTTTNFKILPDGSLNAFVIGRTDIDATLPVTINALSTADITTVGPTSLSALSTVDAFVGGVMNVTVGGAMNASVGGTLTANVQGTTTLTCPQNTLIGNLSVIGGIQLAGNFQATGRIDAEEIFAKTASDNKHSH